MGEESKYTFNVTRLTSIGELRTMISVGGDTAQIDALIELIAGRLEGYTREQLLALPAVELAQLSQQALAAVATAVGEPGKAVLRALGAVKN